MAQVTSGLYELSLIYTYLGEECRNVWHYLDQAGQDDAADILAFEWNLQNFASVKAVQNTFVQYDRIVVRPLFGNGLDAVQNIGALTGDRPGPAMPRQSSFGWALNRSDKDTRNGAKRLAGLSELDTDSSQLESAFITVLDASALVLEAALSGQGKTFFPAIMKRFAGSTPPTVTISLIQSYTTLNRVGTQNTRKNY